MSATKFEKTRIHFKSDVFVAVALSMLKLPTDTWYLNINNGPINSVFFLHDLHAVQWLKSYVPIRSLSERLCQWIFVRLPSYQLRGFTKICIWILIVSHLYERTLIKKASYHHLYLCMLMILLSHSSIDPATFEEKLNKVYVRPKSVCNPINARYMSKRQNNCLI